MKDILDKHKKNMFPYCAADFSLLNLPKGKSLGRSKPATSSYAQALQHTVRDDSYYIQALLNCLSRNKMSTTNVSELGYLFHDSPVCI